VTHLAGQLTQRWTHLIWGQVAVLLRNPPIFSHESLQSPRNPRGSGPLVRLRPEQVDELVQRYASGKSASALAREFGINQQTALDHLHRRGVDVIRSRKAIVDDQLPKLRELYEDGLSLNQLGEIYRCSHTAVSAALERCGVSRRQAWSVIPPHKVGELEVLRAQGWTYQAIGERYGCSRWTVAKALARTSS
jgi:DNA-binding CsgD family transcriptional regulator